MFKVVLRCVINIFALQFSDFIDKYASMNGHLTKTLTTVTLLATLSIAACKNKQDEAKGKSGKPNNLSAEGYVATAGSFINQYSVGGSLLPNEEIEIHPEINGRVTNILFKEGSKVRKGQTLIKLYNADLGAQVQKLKAQRQLQVKIQERQKQLLDIGGISKQDYETTQTQVAAIDADIAFAQAQMRATRVVAPFDGTIGIRTISVGAVVTPATTITTLQQTHPLKMDFTIPDHYFKLLSVGKEVLFSVTGNNDTLIGKISAIDPGADAATRTVKVRAIVPNPDNKLVAGSFAQVYLPLHSDDNAILIPSQAVIPTTREKKVGVVKNGKAELVTVKLGTRTSDKVEVLQGINVGDTVIITGLMQIKPGMDVKITKVKN
jgi:membrane fusion protein, multidrug efflux system